MKLNIKMASVRPLIDRLTQINQGIKDEFIDGIANTAATMAEDARVILEERSEQRTGKRYWTGNLQQSIDINPTTSAGEITGVSVGPDMRKAPYAEWIEYGHYRVAGDFGGDQGEWWEGYHYMEEAYAKNKDKFIKDIEKGLKTVLSKDLTNFGTGPGGSVRHKLTGQFVKRT